jgi:hypothetical protein
VSVVANGTHAFYRELGRNLRAYHHAQIRLELRVMVARPWGNASILLMVQLCAGNSGWSPLARRKYAVGNRTVDDCMSATS